jgi:hypothetical protein
MLEFYFTPSMEGILFHSIIARNVIGLFRYIASFSVKSVFPLVWICSILEVELDLKDDNDNVTCNCIASLADEEPRVS